MAYFGFWSSCVVFALLLPNNFEATEETFSGSGARGRFERNFNSTCGKYPFVQEYFANLEAPSQRFMVFVFHEHGVSNGGLGDRLAGMISATAFALRTGRTLLISADKAFEEAFQPYLPQNNGRFKWGDWSWSGWKDEYSHGSNITNLRNCVNPKDSTKLCLLDHDFAEKAVKLYSNRAFLCRWVVKPNVYSTSNLARLGITKETDLFEAAGCMLRLAMWPTERLWRALDRSLESQLISRKSAITSYQVGFHFRCGDKSFAKGASMDKREVNSDCCYNPAVPWKGVSFLGKSMESPVDLAVCGVKLLGNLSLEIQKKAMVYIASDNPDSAHQINSTLNWPFVILPPKPCHVDVEASFECTFSTFLQWFMLSLSDVIVMQGLTQPKVGTGWHYEELPPEDGSPRLALEQGSISAFSRFASVYALSSDVTRFGIPCSNSNKTLLSHQSQGNWLCNPKQIY